MARRADASQVSSGGVKSVGAIIAVVALGLAVLVLISARPGPEPFDPRSGRASGARGLVITLESAGANVVDTRTVPDVAAAGATRVLVLDDRLDDEQRSQLLDFVQAGGVAVVADPDSTLHGGSGLDGGAIAVEGSTLTARAPAELERNVRPGRCSIDALGALRGVYVPDGVLFPVGPTEEQCFTEPTDGSADSGGVGGDASVANSFVIVRQFGAGLVIGLGDNTAFVNQHLRRADNAGVITALLVPERDAQVTFLVGTGAARTVQEVGTGDDTLRDLVPTWIWMALALGALAFVVFAVSQSMRPGRILAEPLATPIAGSELISATGNLMQRAKHSSRAAWLIMDRLHRDLCRAYGVPVAAPISELDRVVAGRAGTAPGEIERILRTFVQDDAALVALARAVDGVRRRALSAPSEAHRLEQHEPAPT